MTVLFLFDIYSDQAQKITGVRRVRSTFAQLVIEFYFVAFVVFFKVSVAYPLVFLFQFAKFKVMRRHQRDIPLRRQTSYCFLRAAHSVV